MVSRLLKVRSALPVAGLLVVASLVVAQPAPPPAAGLEPKSVADLRTPQEQNADLFKQFQRELLALAQKLERSDRPEDKERAKVIYAALDLSRKENVQSQFEKMITGMRGGTGNLRDLDQLAGQDGQLQKVLREILTVLMTDDEVARLKAEIGSLEKYLKEVRAIMRSQQIVRGLTDAKRGDVNRIAKDQKDLADRTKDLADRMAGGKKPDGKPGDSDGKGQEGVDKSEPKAEAKDGDAAGDGKSDTQETKADTKGADDGAQAGTDSKGSADAGAESKAGGKDGMPPDAGASKAGTDEGKPAPPGEPRDMGQPKAANDGGKPGSESDKPGGSEAKPGSEGGKPGSEAKPGSESGKPGSESKPGSEAGKPGDPSAQQAGQQSGKPGDSKSQGKGKGSDKQSVGQQGGQGKDQGQQQGQQNQQQAANKGARQQQGGQQGQQAQQSQQQQPGRKQLQEAYPHQQAAEQDLKKNDRDNAGKKEDKAIEALAKAIEELEKRLKQLREEEMLKLLANLEARCNRMLAMQTEVYEATRGIDATVTKNSGNKTTAEIQKAQQQAQKEGEIVAEANKALKLLESEGSAVAFARVLEEVRQDMTAIQRRLDSAYVDRDTQAIEENVIALLKEMVAALKKAQQDIQQQQQQQQQQQGTQKPGNQKLIDLLAELKLIKALQLQVNTRTRVYGDKVGTEQANDPIIQAEVRQLAERQAKLQEMINKIASGENQ